MSRHGLVTHLRGWSLGLRRRVQDFGLGVQGLGRRVEGFGLGVQGLGFGAKGYGPVTENVLDRKKGT